jgi:phospholipase C
MTKMRRPSRKKPVSRKIRRRPAVKSTPKSKRSPQSRSKPRRQPQSKPASSRASRTASVIAKGSVEHVVIILKENHTFDSYFGTFPGANGDSSLAHASNPPQGTFSNNHAAWLARATKAVQEQYLQSDIPSYWAYAQQFTLCDNFFTDVASDSTPNHLMLIAADSPVINNPPSSSQPSYNIPSLPANLQAAGLTWRSYGSFAFPYITALQGNPWNLTSEQFVTDATAGNLASVSWVYPPSGSSEHPPDNVTTGMEWTVAQVNAIVSGGLWPDTAIFITWDDWGGWYDHVTPANVEQWTDGTQFRYGSRVPCLVLGPFAKTGYISKVLFSFVSIVRFCEENFGLAPINQRDGSADSMADCFNFAQTPLAPPK